MDYPIRWLEEWREDLTLTPTFIAGSETFKAVQNERIVGFHALLEVATTWRLEHLWVEPEWMGRGIGRALFQHAATRAIARGAGCLTIESDPHAEAFYRHMGANRTVEPRANGPTTIVFAFSEDIVAADGMISSNEFTITNATFSSASISGNTLTLNLIGVIDQSVVSVTLNGINDTNNNPLTGDNDVEIRALVGDADQDQNVTRADLQAVMAHAGQTLEQMSGNYLFDLNLDGVIGKLDGRVVRQNKLHTVP